MIEFVTGLVAPAAVWVLADPVRLVVAVGIAGLAWTQRAVLWSRVRSIVPWGSVARYGALAGAGALIGRELLPQLVQTVAGVIPGA